ncbi:hypothetical protein BT96DRAFT_1006775 [Gymnopus androsaceus JB14]|uniref:Uncharacterized protein n=1 Tax=Gymnopus androsaceus JB14 TaxID=1447944 RepID=A0A6A4GKF1_9AGAR|nr:hypothetical protein BT96DRAFT_1006775 [Gymnopus androsaceus JB14]
MSFSEVHLCPLSNNQLIDLSDGVHNILQSPMDESRSYGVLNEALYMHKGILQQEHGVKFMIIPQLRIPWNPRKKSDKRHNIPDIGLGKLPRDGGIRLQGGAEAKVAVECMKSLPSPDTICQDSDFRNALSLASIQGGDQIKSAIKSGFLPDDLSIEWIVMIGPYFVLRYYGPFNEDELLTRGYRPNDSGDAKVSALIKEMKDEARVTTITDPIHILGTPEGAVALHNYLIRSTSLHA